jgi:hypothetical protein
MSLKKLSYSLASFYDKSNDFEFIKQMEFESLSALAILARREYERTKAFPSSLIREVNCLPIIEVDGSECCENFAGCKILKSKAKIPQIIEVKEKLGYIALNVGFKGKNIKQISYVDPARLGEITSKFSAVRALPYYTIMSEHVYIFNNNEIDFISIVDAFADPRELAKVKDCNNKPCFELGADVNIPLHYVPIIKEMVMKANNRITDSNEVKINE